MVSGYWELFTNLSHAVLCLCALNSTLEGKLRSSGLLGSEQLTRRPITQTSAVRSYFAAEA